MGNGKTMSVVAGAAIVALAGAQVYIIRELRRESGRTGRLESQVTDALGSARQAAAVLATHPELVSGSAKPRPGLPAGVLRSFAVELAPGSATMVALDSRDGEPWLDTLALTFRGAAPGRFALRINGARFPFDPVAEAARFKPAYPDPARRAQAMFTAFVNAHQHFEPPTGTEIDHDPAVFWNAFRYGFCDDLARNFARFAALGGLNARVVGLDAHYAAEAEVAPGRWAHFDPDYQIIFKDQAGTLLSRAEVCRDDRAFQRAFTTSANHYTEAAQNHYRRILCAHGAKPLLTEEHPAVLSPPEPLGLEFRPGDQWDFRPWQRAGRFAETPPENPEEPPAGHVLVQWRETLTPGAVVAREFALPIVRADARIEAPGGSRGAMRAAVARLNDVGPREVTAALGPEGEAAVKLIGPADVTATGANAGAVSKLEVRWQLEGTPGNGPMSAVFIVALQLAPAAFPAWRVGTNELAAETTAPATVAAQLAIRQTPATALMPPSTPLRPADKAVVPRTPFALAWPEAGNPGVRYQIDVSADDAFVAPLVPVLHHPAAVPRLILDAQSLENFAPGHTYYWRVRLIDPWGRASAFSPAWSFRVE